MSGFRFLFASCPATIIPCLSEMVLISEHRVSSCVASERKRQALPKVDQEGI